MTQKDVNSGLIRVVQSFLTHQLGREEVTMKKLTAACMIFAMATGFATMSVAEGTGEEECFDDCGPEPKGNNGWGNGIDGDNPGTTKGGTAETKMNVPGVDPDKEARFGGR